MGKVATATVSLLWGIGALLGAAVPSQTALATTDRGEAEMQAAGLERLEVAFEASHLVLGRQRSVELTVSGPAAATAPLLTSNIGQVGPARRMGPGRWQATYSAPDTFFPQVAIVSASMCDASLRATAVGAASLPLWGRGLAEVRTQRRAQVTVRIGGETFGPVQADASGTAQVEVVVPPGVDHGWDGPRRVALAVPPTSRMHAVALDRRVVGTTPGRARVLVLVADRAGKLTAAAAPRAALPGAATSAAAAIRPLGVGQWLAEVEVPAGPPGPLGVKLSLPDDETSAAEAVIERIAGPPASVVVEAPAAVNDDDPVTVSVRVTDALGTAVDGQRVTAAAVIGRFGPVRHVDRGQYRVRWGPPRFSARKAVELGVTVDGVAGRAEIELRYPPRAWRRRLAPPWLWTAVGVSSALLLSGAITRGVALDKSSEYKDPATSIDRRHQLKDSGEPLSAYSSVALGVGAAAALGTAVICYFTDFDRGSSERRWSTPGLLPAGGLTLGTRF